MDINELQLIMLHEAAFDELCYNLNQGARFEPVISHEDPHMYWQLTSRLFASAGYLRKTTRAQCDVEANAALSTFVQEAQICTCCVACVCFPARIFVLIASS